jgi:hypothetical protein
MFRAEVATLTQRYQIPKFMAVVMSHAGAYFPNEESSTINLWKKQHLHPAVIKAVYREEYVSFLLSLSLSLSLSLARSRSLSLARSRSLSLARALSLFL